jgi:hypothetical protein
MSDRQVERAMETPGPASPPRWSLSIIVASKESFHVRPYLQLH